MLIEKDEWKCSTKHLMKKVILFISSAVLFGGGGGEGEMKG